MNAGRPLLLLALAALAAACGPHHPPAADAGDAPVAALSTNSVRVGDVVNLRLTVPRPAGGRVELPDLNQGRAVVVREVRQPEGEQTATRAVYDIALTSLMPSNHVLAPGGIVLVDTQGVARTAAFPFVTLEVRSLLQGTNDTIRPAQGLAHWPNQALRRAILIGAVALVLAAGLLVWLARRAARARPPAPPAPPTPPHVLALAALRELLARPWIEERNVEPFYVELSGIVRTYLERRFGLHAPEQTTDEFIREATSSRLLSLDHQQLVGAFLEQSDLVKFARHQPESADMRNAAAAAERLIQETVPGPAAGPGGPAP